jgi:predicted RNase H-like nuclease
LTAVRHRGPQLPYQLLAGVEPCRDGWLVVSGKLQGITVSAQEPEVVATFVDVLDTKPAFAVIALHAPIGLLPEYGEHGRACDRAARRLLGFPRASAIVSPPGRKELAELLASDQRHGIGTQSTARLLHVAEIDDEIQPYWQRTVFEVNPELAFFTLNNERPLRYAKRTHRGQQERRALLEPKIPGIGRVLDARIRGISRSQLLDGAADLMTCRRIMSRAVARVPEDPEWDDQGLRMELIR